MNRYLAVVYDEKKKKMDYEEVIDVPDVIQKGDAAICIINALSKHQKLVNFWPLWELSTDDIK